MAKIGRNEKCPCRSGKKFKHCCALTEREQVKQLTPEQAMKVTFMACSGVSGLICSFSLRAQQCLNFFPLRQGHFSFLPIFAMYNTSKLYNTYIMNIYYSRIRGRFRTLLQIAKPRSTLDRLPRTPSGYQP
mgnify:CR=1 FL=1